jgi:hypothetical protein
VGEEEEEKSPAGWGAGVTSFGVAQNGLCIQYQEKEAKSARTRLLREGLMDATVQGCVKPTVGFTFN